LSTVINNPEQAGELAGTRAAQKYRAAAEAGRPLSEVPALHPSQQRKEEVRRMVTPPSEGIRYV
jgi:hypothetical protein